MNKRRRGILEALAPVAEFAMEQAPGLIRMSPREPGEKPVGFSFRPRVSADAPAEIMIYGAIGASWWGDGVTAVDVADALRDAGPGPVNVRINSGGGDVFQGVAIHTLLSRHAGTVTTYVDGLAASAASFIMLAGDRIRSARNAMVMIHDGMTSAYGNASTLRRAADLADKASENIADMYAERAGEDAAYWREVMTRNAEDGVWFTGPEALDAGLVDELISLSKGEDGADDETFGTEAYASRLLATWRDIIPANLAATISFPDDPKEDPSEDETSAHAPAWDVALFRDLLRGVTA